MMDKGGLDIEEVWTEKGMAYHHAFFLVNFRFNSPSNIFRHQTSNIFGNWLK